MSGLREALRTNSLTLVFGAGFVAALVAQALVGHAEYNGELLDEGLHPVGLGSYVLSSDFAVDVTENWQSEFLQFFLYILGTVWLLQRGSPESKELDDAGTGTDEEQYVGRFAVAGSPRWAAAGGWRRVLYANSLGLVMGLLFLLSWLAQSVAGAAAYNESRLRALQPPMSWTQYVAAPDFWSRTLQNWQSELLAVGAMAILSVYLRQRGSPESKPVGVPHGATNVEG